MAQVTPNTSYNVIKVYSVGLQGATGAPGPTGSLQPSNSGSFSITGSLTVSGSGTLTNVGPAIFSGSVTSTSGFTGSLAGTATTASYISPTFISASAAASGFSSGGGSTNTGSLMVTGSVSNATLTFIKGDGSTFPLTVNNVTNATSASFVTTASFALNAVSASYALTASFFSGSISNAISASFATSSSLALTASFLNGTALSSSYALTASYALSGGSGGGGSTFPFSGSAFITGSLIISGTLGGGTGDTRGLQVSNNGQATLRINSNTAASIAEFDGQTTQMYLSSNNSLGGTQISNMFFNTTFSGMGDGSGLGFINFAQGSGTSNDSFGSIRTYLKGVNKSEVRIYSQTAGVGILPDISFISGSLIDVNRKIETDQDIEITDSSKGIILRSPNGTRYRITINDSGILVSGSI